MLSIFVKREYIILDTFVHFAWGILSKRKTLYAVLGNLT